MHAHPRAAESFSPGAGSDRSRANVPLGLFQVPALLAEWCFPRPKPFAHLSEMPAATGQSGISARSGISTGVIAGTPEAAPKGPVPFLGQVPAVP